MGKATVLNCDVCGAWDSEDNPVRTVNVAGPRFQICTPCRVDKIVDMGVDRVKALAYVDEYNQRDTTRGATLALNAKAVRERLATMVAPANGDGNDPNQVALSVVDGQLAGDATVDEPLTATAADDGSEVPQEDPNPGGGVTGSSVDVPAGTAQTDAEAPTSVPAPEKRVRRGRS